MAMEWFRMYHGMPFDTKLRVVAKRAGQPMGVAVVVWACLLDAASQSDPRGIAVVDAEEIAVALDFEPEAIEAVLTAMLDKGMIDEDGHLTAWDKRQHTTSTERSKKSRAKKKTDATDGNAKQRGATRGSTVQRKKGKKDPDTDKTTDTDLDENTDVESDLKKETDKKTDTREEKKESEEEKQQISGKDKKLILHQMLDIWNEEVQSKITNGQKAILTDKRKELLSLRFIDEFAEDIRAWRYFCEIIGKSDFCLGKIEGKDWTIDLTWAIQSADRIAKILEGGFSGGKHPSKPPSCALPEFADAWDEVLGRMAHHHGKPIIRSWFSNTEITAAEETPDGVILRLEVPREFVRGWIEQHYLTDLNHCWDEQSSCSRPVVGVQLAIKEAQS